MSSSTFSLLSWMGKVSKSQYICIGTKKKNKTPPTGIKIGIISLVRFIIALPDGWSITKMTRVRQEDLLGGFCSYSRKDDGVFGLYLSSGYRRPGQVWERFCSKD